MVKPAAEEVFGPERADLLVIGKHAGRDERRGESPEIDDGHRRPPEQRNQGPLAGAVDVRDDAVAVPAGGDLPRMAHDIVEDPVGLLGVFRHAEIELERIPAQRKEDTAAFLLGASAEAHTSPSLGITRNETISNARNITRTA